MPERIRLSHKAIEELPVPLAGRNHVYDAVTPGLAVCSTPTGKRLFYWIGKVRRSATRIRIGEYPQTHLEAARKEAKRIAADIANGVAPRTSRRKAESALTLGKVFAHFMAHVSRPHKRTWKRDERRFERTLASWARTPLGAISKAEIRNLHVRLGETKGQYAANATLELLSTLFNYAAENLDWTGANPVRGVQRFPVTERDRFLSGEELARFFVAVAGLQRETSRDFFLLALFTGARRGNVCSMRWSDVDMERREWRIAAGDSKNKEPMTIVLSEAAMDILNRRKKTVTGRWVLPGHGSAGHYKWPKGAWQEIVKAAQLENVRIHDLRRTLGSWQAMNGASLLVIGKSLGHSSLSATRVYARLQMDPVKESVEGAVAEMLAAAHRAQEKSKNSGSILGALSAVPGAISASKRRRSKKPKS